MGEKLNDKKIDSGGLNSLSYEELKKVIFDRLHGHQTMGPPIDPRGDYDPYLWLTEQYKNGNDDLRKRMEKIAEEFMRHIIDLIKWPKDARSNLLCMVREFGVTNKTLERIIGNRQAFNELGAQVYASLLKCFVSIGEKGAIGFWLEQLELLGNDYGGIIFSGLRKQHGLQIASEFLRQCCGSSIKAAHSIKIQLIVMIAQHGLEEVRKEIEPRLPHLPDKPRQILEKALAEQIKNKA